MKLSNFFSDKNSDVVEPELVDVIPLQNLVGTSDEEAVQRLLLHFESFSEEKQKAIRFACFCGDCVENDPLHYKDIKELIRFLRSDDERKYIIAQQFRRSHEVAELAKEMFSKKRLLREMKLFFRRCIRSLI